MKLLFVPNFDKERTIECLESLKQQLSDGGCEIMMQAKHRERAAGLADVFDHDLKAMLSRCDAVIAVGGDGTIIHAAKLAGEAKKPILGINTGTLGFIAGMEYSEPELIKCLLTGDYSLQKRMMLDVELISGGRTVLSGHAINEAVVSRGAFSRIIELNVTHNGCRDMGIRADGLIISTPTGSTAYALSAGGPVIDPTVQCIELTPVCPHTLTSRPTIVDCKSEIIIEPVIRGEDRGEGARDEATLSVDGDFLSPVVNGDIIRVRRSKISVSFIIIKKLSIAETLHQKLT